MEGRESLPSPIIPHILAPVVCVVKGSAGHYHADRFHHVLVIYTTSRKALFVHIKVCRIYHSSSPINFTESAARLPVAGMGKVEDL